MFSCSNCDAQFPKWSGRCTECGKWGTVGEEGGQAERPRGKETGVKTKAAVSKPISEAAGAADPGRIETGIPEIDRVLGGGMMRGALVLLSGEPGIGKSTLVAQVAGSHPSLYVSGEESAPQLAGRFARLGLRPDAVNFLEALPIETIVATIENERPSLAIVDSVQTLVSSELDSGAGTPAMVRYATSLLLDLAKRTNIPVLLIGQVTKDGAIAGPKTLEHLVDVVVSLEGDPVHAYRILRATKNRFGATDEVGVFEMTATGLATVENPSGRFLEERRNVPGSVIAATMEGSRVFLVEVQALVEKSSYGTPVRRASGFDQNRLQMLCAILSKHAGLKLGEADVYVNVIGGLELREPAADLAVCAAIVSAAGNVAAEKPAVYVGEVGLGGETRSVPNVERRTSEAKRMGIDTVLTPKSIKTVREL
ncbi:DNA repair protein RadA [Candidatus Uhrbacteria bacterium RIFOXYB12_FULL_58_10]|nr:MAG: DNA repair protein RadA [Candidatus Uhrbacteria bacterium RIFOXYB12_FULL_58_10]